MMKHWGISYEWKISMLMSGKNSLGMRLLLMKLKIVLARRRMIKFDKPISIPYVLNRALQSERNSYLFILESNQSVFFSQTPEQLLKVEDGVLSTKAVAGTIKRSNDIDEDEKNIQAFLKDKKNLDEHDFVVKSILDDIKPYVDNIEYNHSPNIFKNDHLYHLYTQIQGQLKNNSFIGLIDEMHPTPALGGYPKMKHSNLLKKMNLEHEAYMVHQLVIST